MTLEVRSFASLDLEIRADGRTIAGIAVPFDTPTRINSFDGPYTESFARGAFARTIAERGPGRVKVLGLHNDRTMPLGRAQLLREDANGLYAELRISKTAAGDEALELVRDGALDGLSVGFMPVRDEHPSPGVVRRAEVRLHEISVVPFPAYDGARINAVRSTAPATPFLTLALRRQMRADLDILEIR